MTSEVFNFILKKIAWLDYNGYHIDVVFVIFSILHFYFKGKNATQIAQTCQEWFVKFHAGDFNLNNACSSERPVEFVIK